MINYGQTQNSIFSLPTLNRDRYENIFNVYKSSSDDQYYFYNILNKVVLPEIIDDTLIDSITLNRNLPWTTLSYRIYNTISLWWLIVLLNKPKNIFFAEAGVEYTYIVPSEVNSILDNIIQQVNR
jgi:hypothetical protein